MRGSKEQHLDNTPLVCLHPVGLDERCFDGLGIAGTIVPAMPGHGGRRRPRAGLSLDDAADELAGWTKGTVDVLGASLGGMVALHFALNYPERVRSLVLSCTTAGAARAVMLDRAETTQRRGALAMTDETIARWFSPSFLRDPSSTQTLQYVRESLQRMDTGSLADTWRAIADHDVISSLGAIDCPVTCIAGLQDVSMPYETMRQWSERLPNVRLVALDAGHMAHFERPVEFCAAVQEHRRWARTAVSPPA